jgi:hypothetical protein
MIVDHWEYHGLMLFEVAQGAGLVGTHERAVAGNVGGEDCCETALLAIGHNGSPA